MIQKKLLIAVSASIALAACFDTGGGGGAGGGSITSGDYVVSNAAKTGDTCDFFVDPSTINGLTTAVVVDTGAGTVFIEAVGAELTLSGNTFTFDFSETQADFFGDGTCLVDVVYDMNGNITGTDEFDFSWEVNLTNGSTGCSTSNPPVATPCNPTLTLHAAKQ